jgi:regulator of protease activity HflC (stomatin/prohibitin superfamily)
MGLIYIVPQSHCAVIERFGKFSRIQQQGLCFRVPLFEKIRNVTDPPNSWGKTANRNGWLIELTEQQTNTPKRECHTKDNVPVQADASVYWRITDPCRALYEVDVLPLAISDIALNALRSNIGTLVLDAVLSERAKLNERIAAQLSETAQKWGVIFTRVEIQELITDEKVEQSMVKQMDAERERRAKVSEAEGDAEYRIKVAEAEKQALILLADGERQAMVLRAEGEAIAKAKIAEAETFYLKRLKEQVGETEAMQIVIAQKYLSGFETISKESKKGGDKVFLPNSFQGLFSTDTNK